MIYTILLTLLLTMITFSAKWVKWDIYAGSDCDNSFLATYYFKDSGVCCPFGGIGGSVEMTSNSMTMYYDNDCTAEIFEQSYYSGECTLLGKFSALNKLPIPGEFGQVGIYTAGLSYCSTEKLCAMVVNLMGECKNETGCRYLEGENYSNKTICEGSSFGEGLDFIDNRLLVILGITIPSSVVLIICVICGLVCTIFACYKNSVVDKDYQTVQSPHVNQNLQVLTNTQQYINPSNVIYQQQPIMSNINRSNQPIYVVNNNQNSFNPELQTVPLQSFQQQQGKQQPVYL